MRELKKIRIKRISIVSSPATTSQPWIMTKSMDNIDDDPYSDIPFPLVVPSHLLEKWEREEALQELEKQQVIDKGADPEDPYPSIQLYIPSHLLKKDDDDDEEDE